MPTETPKKPKAANGWGIVDETGQLWPDCKHSRQATQQDTAAFLGEPWKRLYRLGYRCIRVTLIPSTATMLDALAGITGVD